MAVPGSVLVPIAIFMGVLFLLGASLMGVAGRRYRFHSGIVQGVTGDLGGGKSMFVVAKILRPVSKGIASRRGLHCQHTQRPCTRIITNFTYDPTVFGYDVPVVVLSPQPDASIWQQILQQCNVSDDGTLSLDAVVVVDEMSLFAPSDTQVFDPIAKAFMVHVRKLNAEFVWIAQDAMQVHKRARKFTRRVWWLTDNDGWYIGLSPWRWFRAEAYRPEDIDKPIRSSLDRRNVRATRKVMSAYDSMEIIASDIEELVALEAATVSLRRARDAGQLRNDESIPIPIALTGQNRNDPTAQDIPPHAAGSSMSNVDAS